ncbi:hypothetical protein AVV48_gp32 [Acinetobacter phage phiAC-1]|uniref:hypothetical protein n=1 Tax=Acinetobacter phage phiAC-1 TaxID=1229760 RepID=UPI00028BB024|nr:hypothetical protein AVV48_gp32 [Acinetobacter phage phiAC-1]AFU62281.1 hypothetical protein phiAC-1_0032 [Acinetobacter phage phiAC-1]
MALFQFRATNHTPIHFSKLPHFRGGHASRIVWRSQLTQGLALSLIAIGTQSLFLIGNVRIVAFPTHLTGFKEFYQFH